jgi:protein required for attachment to host cells
MKKRKPDWLVVCDASRARILRVPARDEEWTELECVSPTEGRARSGALVSDRPGRAIRPGGLGRQAPVDAADPTDAASRRFALELGRRLERGFDAHEYEALILVAPPRFLGQVRDALTPPVRRRVRVSLDKDLMRVTTRELRERVRPLLEAQY